jgi:rfaE bifunctional protein kinase chain/domain
VNVAELFSNAEELAAILDRFPQQRMAVVGDFFLDKYLIIDAALEEPSLETGLPAHQVVRIHNSPGAAGTVVNNLVALDAGRVSAFGFVGDDGEGYDLRKALVKQRVDVTSLLVDPGIATPTYMKPVRRSVDGHVETELERMDVLNRRRTTTDLGTRLAESLSSRIAEFSAVIVVDQVPDERGGCIDSSFRLRLAELGVAHPSVFIFADSRFSIGEFAGVALKPNIHEAARATGGRTVDPLELANALQRRSLRDVFLTCGGDGMVVAGPETSPRRVDGISIPEPIDPTGAGDSASAGIALSMASGATNLQAAAIGNLVASITVQQLRTTGTASREGVLKRFQAVREKRSIGFF